MFRAHVPLAAGVALIAAQLARAIWGTDVLLYAHVALTAEMVLPATGLAFAIGSADEVLPRASVALEAGAVLLSRLGGAAREKNQNNQTDQQFAHALSLPASRPSPSAGGSTDGREGVCTANSRKRTLICSFSMALCVQARMA